MAGLASASDPYIYQKAIINKPTIINKIISLNPPKAQIDNNGIIAKAYALEIAFQTVYDKKLETPKWRQFRFQNNMKYKASVSNK